MLLQCSAAVHSNKLLFLCFPLQQSAARSSFSETPFAALVSSRKEHTKTTQAAAGPARRFTPPAAADRIVHSSFSSQMKSVFSGGFDYSGFARRRITPPASPRASWTRVGASFEDDEFTSGRGGDSIHGADVGSSSNAFGDQQQVRRSSSPREPVPQQQDSQQALGGNGNGGNGSGKMTSSGILIGSSSRAYVTAAGGGAAAVNDAREQEKEAALLQGGSLPSPREPLLPSPRSRPGGSLISLSKYYLAFLVVGASANSFGASKNNRGNACLPTTSSSLLKHDFCLIEGAYDQTLAAGR